jgi:hypothetical protein
VLLVHDKLVRSSTAGRGQPTAGSRVMVVCDDHSKSAYLLLLPAAKWVYSIHHCMIFSVQVCGFTYCALIVTARFAVWRL